MTETDERFVLKNCPFCGGKPEVRRSVFDGSAYWWIQCRTCGSETRSNWEVDKAIGFWNKRYDVAVEELKNKRVCANCKWRSDEFTSVCVNDESEHLADFVTGNMTCEKWEQRGYVHPDSCRCGFCSTGRFFTEGGDSE